MPDNTRYAVIMAGGAGTRLWPLSRKSRPKQLVRILGDKSLLDEAVERLSGSVGPEYLYIITNRQYVEQMVAAYPQIPPENIIGEPQGRDTANAIGLAAAVIHQRDPEAVMGVFTADHIITPAETFRRVLDSAFAYVAGSPNSLITFGIPPTWPHTGMGYIQRGEKLGEGVFRVKQFKEKPDETTAAQYLADGDYYWNGGMFVWRAATILEKLQQLLPDSAAGLDAISKAWNTDSRIETLDRIFPTLPKISIDYAVMEKVALEGKVIVVELPCRWLDVGSWPALAEVLDPDEAGNRATAKKTHLLDARNNILISEDPDHLLVAIGVNDLIVVHSPDATLVCPNDQAEKIKSLVGEIQQIHDGKHV